MKRFFLVLAVAGLMAMMVVVMAVPALAQPIVECEWDYFDEGWFAQYCWSPDFGWWIDDWWKAWQQLTANERKANRLEELLQPVWCWLELSLGQSSCRRDGKSRQSTVRGESARKADAPGTEQD